VPTGLLADLLPQGLGIPTAEAPLFSWQVPDGGAGTVQSAYRIQVAASPELLGAGGRMLWDSGRIASAESTAVAYGGPSLSSRTAYWWRVCTWGPRASGWSQPAILATSMDDAWEAVPIWVPGNPGLTDGTLAVRVQIETVAASLWFRASSVDDNYLWQLRVGSPGVLKKHVCVNGVYTVLDQINLPFAITAGQSIDFSVAMTGSTFVTTINGTVVDTTTDTTYASGNVGLRNGSTESQAYSSFTFTGSDGTVLLDDTFPSGDATFSAGTVANSTLTFPDGAASLTSQFAIDNAWALLRHEYDLPRTGAGSRRVAAAILYAAATSPVVGHQYVAKVWSNGMPVAYTSVRAASGAAYQAFDITDTLRPGAANALAALCWTTGDQKFLAQLEVTYTDGTRQTVESTGSTWKCRRENGLLPDKGNAGSSYYTVPQEYWNLNYEPIGWTEPGFDDSSWVAPVQQSAIADLSPALIEPVQLSSVTPASVTQTAAGTWLVDLGREIVGGLRITLNGSSGETIEVRLGEQLNADGSVKYQLLASNTYREVWTLRDGEQTFEHWGYRGYRWAELLTTVDLSSATIRGRAWKLEYDATQTAFSSSDADLDRVWEFCRYSAEATRGDLYDDSPTRERGPYEGDALINRLSENAVQRSYALARYSDSYLVRNGTWPTEYGLMCAISAWQDYLATGDSRQLASDYTLLAAKNLTKEVGSDGLVHESSTADDLVDWPAVCRDAYVFTSVNTVINAWQYAAFDAMSNIASMLGNTTDAATLRTQADALQSSLLAQMLDTGAGAFIDGAGTTHSAQQATVFPVALGVADSLSTSVLASLGTTLAATGMQSSPYGAQFLLDALFRLGQAEAAIALMTATGTWSWLHMMDGLDATIVGECWDPSLKSNMTFSHIWSSAPVNVIARQVLGVQVTAAGAAGFLVRPRIGGLSAVSGTVPSMRGPVTVSVRKSATTQVLEELEVTLPPNTSNVVEVEIGSAKPSAYRVSATAPGGRGRVPVTPVTDVTGTVLRIGPVGSGSTTVRPVGGA
jgi:alpha-L-rhamnosidase